MNRLVLITGGGSGMGRHIALTLSGSNVDVIVVGRREGPLQATAAEAGPGTIECVTADVSTTAGTQALAAAVGGRPLTGIVTAAGGQNVSRDLDAGNPIAIEQIWTESLRKNLYSAVLPVEALAPQLVDGEARIVLISSTAALGGEGGPYATAKAALTGYCMDLASRLGPRAITANVVAPGFVADTEFFEAGGLGSADAFIDSAAKQTLVGRVGNAGDVSHIVVNLLASEAGWITGQVISPNGGTHFVH